MWTKKLFLQDAMPLFTIAALPAPAPFQLSAFQFSAFPPRPSTLIRCYPRPSAAYSFSSDVLNANGVPKIFSA
jgi:hypothetical protein